MRKTVFSLILVAACGSKPSPQTTPANSTAAAPTDSPASDADKAKIHAVVVGHEKAVRTCYEQQLLQNPQLVSGKLTVNFKIDEHGAVAAAEAAAPFQPEVDACVLAEVKTWQFPDVEKKPLDISYPFVFRADTGDVPPAGAPHK